MLYWKIPLFLPYPDENLHPGRLRFRVPAHISPNRFFLEKLLGPLFKGDDLLPSCRRSEKTNDKILRKVQKTLILGYFGPKYAECDFFSKIGLRHFFRIMTACFIAKFQEKQMSRYWVIRMTDGQTDRRTDGHRRFYSTFASRVQKMKFS